MKDGVTAGTLTPRSEHSIADFHKVEENPPSGGDVSIRRNAERTSLPGSEGCNLFHMRLMQRCLFSAAFAKWVYA
jgi:hypothetical protein